MLSAGVAGPVPATSRMRELDRGSIFSVTAHVQDLRMSSITAHEGERDGLQVLSRLRLAVRQVRDALETAADYHFFSIRGDPA